MDRLIYCLLIVFLLPFFIKKSFKQNRLQPHPQGIKQRFTLSLPKIQSNKPLIWLHLSSLGEVNSIKSLVKKLIDKTNNPILITTTTNSGWYAASQIEGVTAVLQPFDFKFLINRFIKHFKPHLLLVSETEMWPNMWLTAHNRKVPIWLINARLTEKSVLRYKRFIPKLAKKMLAISELIQTQSVADKNRFMAINPQLKNIEVGFNFKWICAFDNAYATKAHAFRKSNNLDNKFIWLVASSHAPEEKLMLEIQLRLLKLNPNILLIIAPRHKQRFIKVEKIIAQYLTNTVVQHSTYSKESSFSNSQVILADTLGMMNFWYQLVDLVVVGGTFCEVHGHNMIEPMATKTPVIVGKNTDNFKSIVADCLDAKAIIQAKTTEEVYNLIAKIQDKHHTDIQEQMATMTNNALKLIQSKQDILNKLVEKITT